jgi:hypothetical protein
MNPDSLNIAASAGSREAYLFVEKFNDIILYPLILLLTGIAFLVFLYGCLIYITHAENSSAREQGRSHIIYSILGMFVMMVAYTILQIAASTFGIEDVLDCSNNPNTPGCNNVMRVPGRGGDNEGGIGGGDNEGGLGGGDDEGGM